MSQLVAERLPRAARLDGDVFAMMLVSGWANMLDADGNWNPGPEGQRQLQLRMINVCSTADNFAEAGYTPVVDHIVETRAELEFFAQRQKTRPLMLVVLCPPLEVARHRNETRDPGLGSTTTSLRSHSISGASWAASAGGSTPVSSGPRRPPT
ncbi:hypothetical protein GCM10029992_29310 [Glycomyces albus]